MELHRGIVGFQEAVKMLVDVVRFEKGCAMSEVKKHTQTPLQPIIYLAGGIEYMMLKEKCEKNAGRDFDLRVSHDELLSFGSIPAGLIDDRMLN